MVYFIRISTDDRQLFAGQLRLEKSNCVSVFQALALNKDGNFFASGGFSRYLRIWRTHDLALLHTYPPCDGSIRALAISTDQRYGDYNVSEGLHAITDRSFCGLLPRTCNSPLQKL